MRGLRFYFAFFFVGELCGGSFEFIYGFAPHAHESFAGVILCPCRWCSSGLVGLLFLLRDHVDEFEFYLFVHLIVLLGGFEVGDILEDTL